MDFGIPFIYRAAGLAATLALGLGVTACGKGREEEKADQYPEVQSEQPAQTSQPAGTMGSEQSPPPPADTAPSTAPEPMPGTEGQTTEETPPK